VDTIQTGLFEALPDAIAISADLLARWYGGAFLIGLRHGAYCLGCCWLLMGILFAVGVMNLAWIAALSVFVLLEKILPKGLWVAKLAGLALIGFGGWIALSGGT
jgi:predicted metal-binding membrane protein